MIFADELPLESINPGQAVMIVIVFGCILFFLNVGVAVAALITFAKRRPAIDAEFATKKEVAAGFARVDADIKHLDDRNEEIAKQIFSELKSINSSVNHELNEMNRAIGKLEGHRELGREIAEGLKR